MGRKKSFVCVCKILVENSRADFFFKLSNTSVPTPEPTIPSSTEAGLPPAALPAGTRPMPGPGGYCCLWGSSAEGAGEVH